MSMFDPSALPSRFPAVRGSFPESTRYLERVGSRAVVERAASLLGPDADLVGSLGVPVIPMPEHVRAAVMEAMDEPDPRAPRGLDALRQAIAVTLDADYGVQVDSDKQLLITHGAMHGLSLTLRTLLEPGDEVVVPTPTFFFEGFIRSTSAQPVYVRGMESDGWRWDLEAIEAAITPYTRVLLLCNPNNPTGYVPSWEDVDAAINIARRHGLVVVSDESYQRYTHDGAVFTPVSAFQDAYPNLVTVTSFSKNYALTSWRMGYVLASETLTNAFATAFEWDAISCGYVAQRAALAAISGPQDWIAPVIKDYERKRDLVYAAVERSPVLDAVKPQAGPFMLLNCAGLGTEAAIDRLLLSRGIVTVPGRYLRAPSTHVRLLFGASDPLLERLVSELDQLTNEVEFSVARD